MKLLFRADGSASIGIGHMMRCLALAQAARDAGDRVLFVTAPGTNIELLKTEGCEVSPLASRPGSPEDAEETAGIAQRESADWVIVDGYQFDASYQKRLKAERLRLLFIDDYGHGAPSVADLILNQNSYAPALATWYEQRPASSPLLLGCAYTLLRREFLSAKRSARKDPEVASSVLVTMGGGDPRNATLKVVEALQRIRDLPLQVNIVVGGLNPHRREIEEAAAGMRIVVNAQNMPELMAQADFAITASGTTTYELAFLGVPMLLCVLTENQRLLGEDWCRRDAARPLGDPLTQPAEETARRIRAFAEDAAGRTTCAQNALRLVDGRGSERVLEALSPMLKIRPATPEDARLLFSWANDPVVRAASFSSAPIPWEEHCQWFKDKLQDKRCHIFIALEGGRLVGQIRFDEGNDGEADIDLHLAPAERGRGLGTALISEGLRALFASTKIRNLHSLVKTDNAASRKAFLKAGFTELGKETVHGQEVYHLIFRRP